jgi:hypothetical protein
MSIRSMMKDLKENTDIINYQKVKEGKLVAAAADQRNPDAEAFIAHIPSEVENDQRESVKKLAQTYDVSAKMVHTTLHKDWSSLGGWPFGCPIRQKRR